MYNKIRVEMVRDFDNTYYANMTIDGEIVKGLPEYVDYRTLNKAIRNQTGFCILRMKDLRFKKYGRKSYAYFNNYGESEAINYL